MARITKEQRENNLTSFNELILNIFLNEGWDSVTYDRLAKETGLRKSTLQGYYPSNKDFAIAINGRVLPIIQKKLNFSSKETLVDSWIAGLADKQFKIVMRMLIAESVREESASSTHKGISNMIKLIEHHLPNESGQHILESLLGKTILELIQANNPDQEA